MPNDLKTSDYTEPDCPFCTPDTVPSVPIGRILEKLDSLFADGDTEGAERLLHYWAAEAEQCGDRRGLLTLVNELVGLNRKQGKEEALTYAGRALSLASELGLDDSVTMGTTLVNAATAHQALSRPEEALALFERALPLYERYLKPEDGRLAGLYNNMALTCTDLGAYPRARELYGKALALTSALPDTLPEAAITCCNLADLAAAELGEEAAETEIGGWLEKAMSFLNDENVVRDAHYAYVCRCCAPVFGYYGYFLYERQLHERT